jgi:tripartite-type tricarboxylate transporter receptor subunit TctC
MRRITRLSLGLTAVSALTLTACGSEAGSSGSAEADFPSEDITLIVQAAAGGGSDLASRALAGELEKVLGTSVIVENRPGASGSTAMAYVADQEADGYTIGFSPVEIAMLGHLNFDVDPADYDFLGQIMNSPGVLSVPTDSPHQDFEAFVEAAQSETMSVSNSGAGSIWEAAALGVAEETGAQIEPVPFDGGAPAVAAAIGGQVDAAVGGAAETSAAADEGQLRPLVVFADERHPRMPDVPTAEELGFDLHFGGWGGIYAPAGLPDDVRETLAGAIEEAANSDGFVDTITTAGALSVYKTPEEFTDFVQSEYERFGPLLNG